VFVISAYEDIKVVWSYNDIFTAANEAADTVCVVVVRFIQYFLKST